MTAEKRYQELVQMIRDYAQAAGDDLAQAVIDKPHDFAKNKYVPFYPVAARLLIECIEKMGDTPTSKLAALKRIYKNSESMPIKGVCFKDDFFNILDGCRLVRLKEDVPELPHYDGERGEYYNVKQLMPDLSAYSVVDIPDAGQLKAQAAIAKKDGNKKPFIQDVQTIDGGQIAYNAQYLLDILAIIDDAVLYMPAKPNQVIYIQGSNGDAILLPVRIKKAA